MPALTVNWGAIDEVGFVARNKLDTLSRLGWTAISPHHAFEVVKKCLIEGAPRASVFGVNWAKIAKVMPIISGSPRFSHLIVDDAEDGSVSGTSGRELREDMLTLSEAEAQKRLISVLTQQIARVFDMSVDRLNIDVRLTDLGMDSLMAGQIRNWLAKH